MHTLHPPMRQARLCTTPASLYSKQHVAKVYAIAHLLVDFCSATLVFGTLRFAGDFRLTLLIYNFCAFALQMPIGLIADRYSKSALCVKASCILLAVATIWAAVPGLYTAIFVASLAGFGNCLFHVGAGMEVLQVSREYASPLGVFVAPGALGVFLGTNLGRQSEYSLLIVCLLLGLIAAVLLLARLAQKGLTEGDVQFFIISSNRPPVLLLVICLFLVVCLRSYMAMALTFPWKGDSVYAVVLMSAAMLGKAAGGVLADRLGAARAAVSSLILSAVLLLFQSWPPAGIAAIFLINTTMPVTLWALARVFPGAKGFSFGLLTFALFLGFLAVFFGSPPLRGVYALLAACVAGALLFLGLRRAQ